MHIPFRLAPQGGLLLLSLGCLAGCAVAHAEEAPRHRSFGTRGVIETIGATPRFVRIDEGGESFAFETTVAGTDLHIRLGPECGRSVVIRGVGPGRHVLEVEASREGAGSASARAVAR